MIAFRPLIVTEPPRKCRADYRELPGRVIHQKLGEYGLRQELAETDSEWFDATFALQELRAVLQERGGR